MIALGKLTSVSFGTPRRANHSGALNCSEREKMIAPLVFPSVTQRPNSGLRRLTMKNPPGRRSSKLVAVTEKSTSIAEPFDDVSGRGDNFRSLAESAR